MYLMVTVVSRVEKLKAIIKKLKSLGIKGSIVIDSIGTSNIDNNYMGYRPAIASPISSIIETTHYKKTILSIIDKEEKIELAMDEIEKLLGSNLKKPSTAVMFTIPMVGFQAGSLCEGYGCKEFGS